MSRYKQKFALVGLAGLLAVVVLTISAAPSGATLVCPPGQTNPKYCTDLPPVAQTKPASNVKSESAQLNGVVGPGVMNGDETNYYFQYGKTMSYTQQTPTGTVGSCPPGFSGVNYCKSPATQNVFYVVRGLKPCTTYHYRVVAKNSDGMTPGHDQSFKTKFVPPIQSVKAPRSVKHSSRRHSHHFTVTVRLRTTAQLSVLLTRTFIVRRHHRRHTFTVVYRRYFKSNASGTVKVRFKAPSLTGKYTIRVTGRLSCGSETIRKPIRVR